MTTLAALRMGARSFSHSSPYSVEFSLREAQPAGLGSSPLPLGPQLQAARSQKQVRPGETGHFEGCPEQQPVKMARANRPSGHLPQGTGEEELGTKVPQLKT
jgi:hypothetical protein